MIMFDTLEAICDNIHERFPSNPIYIKKVPEGFARPSFNVAMAAFNDEDAGNKILLRHIAYEVIFFAAKDEDDVVDTISQYASYITMAQLFQNQSLNVKGRHIKITSVNGGPRDAEVYLTINFEYEYVPEDLLTPPEVYELMQNLEIKYNSNL